jgi:methyl-accepting chemotaxis protein
MKLSAKLMIATGSAITVTLALFTSLSTWQAATRVDSEITSLAVSKSAEITQEVRAEIAAAVSAGTSVATGLAGLAESGQTRRVDVIAYLHAIPLRYPNIYGSWMTDLLGQPGGNLFTGAEATNDQHIFTPYWTKDKTGAVAMSTFTVKPEDDWYRLPLAENRSILTDPYVATTGALLTSVTVPVVVKGKAVGLAGVDIELSGLAKTLGALQPFPGGHVMLLANNGTWLVPPDKDLLTKPYSGPGADLAKAAIADGKLKTVTGFDNGMRRFIVPFSAEGMNRTWAIVVDVPANVFTDPVYAEVTGSLIGGLIVLGVALATIYLAASKIVRDPLNRTLATINRLVNREFSVTIGETTRTDEVGAINKALDILRQEAANAERLTAEQVKEQNAKLQRSEAVSSYSREFNDRIASLVDGVMVLANELTSASNTLAGGAETTSRKSTSVASAAEQASMNVEAVASGAEELLASIDEINRRMLQTVQSAESAVTQATTANTRVDALSQAAVRISEVVKLIDAVAQQTNLLALNATIEAARAGEAGKGFAVVAAEVKQLADQTAKATGEIAVQIEAVQAVTTETVATIREISGTIQTINGISQSVQAAMDEQRKATREIATNITEASAGAREVSGSILAVSDAARDSGETARQVNQASARLKTQAESLRAYVEDFIEKMRRAA